MNLQAYGVLCRLNSSETIINVQAYTAADAITQVHMYLIYGSASGFWNAQLRMDYCIRAVMPREAADQYRSRPGHSVPARDLTSLLDSTRELETKHPTAPEPRERLLAAVKDHQRLHVLLRSRQFEKAWTLASSLDGVWGFSSGIETGLCFHGVDRGAGAKCHECDDA